MVRTLIAFVIPALNFVLLVAIGLDLTARDFAGVLRRRLLIAVGLVGPMILLPPIALALAWLFRAAPEIAGSVFLVAACPIGGVSNTFSYLARASTALAVSLTALSCVAAVVSIPVVARAFAPALQQPIGMSAPIPLLVSQLVLMLALPVAAGMWLGRLAPGFGERHGPALRRIALFGTLFVLVLIVSDSPREFLRGLPTTVPLAAVFVTISIVGGWIAAAAFSDDPKDRFTLAASFGSRNVAVAMAIAVTLLGQVAFARFAVTYAFTEVPLMLAAVALFRRIQRPAEVAAEAPDRITDPAGSPGGTSQTSTGSAG